MCSYANIRRLPGLPTRSQRVAKSREKLRAGVAGERGTAEFAPFKICGSWPGITRKAQSSWKTERCASGFPLARE